MDHAILNLTDDLLTSSKKRKFTLGVLIDLSKAFDTVNHGNLLHKLKLYGIKGECHHSVKTKKRYKVKLLLVYCRAPFLGLSFSSYK